MKNVNHRSLIFTGGHHTGALAVAKALKEKGWDIYWIGHKKSQWQDKSDSAEFREVTASGIRFFDLKAGKIYRTVQPVKLIRLPWGFIQAFYIILKLKLQLKSDLKGIVSFGGYLAVPVVFCGRLAGLPSITHEQTLTAGWANKVIAVFAEKIAISWPESKKHYPAGKVVLTGLPVRKEITDTIKNLSIIPKIPDQIYITGGKQGSHAINAAVFAALPQLLKKYRVIHQTGSSTVFGDYQKALKLRSRLPPTLRSGYQVSDYINSREVARILAGSQVVVSRSGAHIVQELGLFGTKCVLIPIPWSSHQEQQHNAQLLSSSHQAIILPQSRLDASNLIKSISQAENLKPQKLPIVENGLSNMVQLIESYIR